MRESCVLCNLILSFSRMETKQWNAEHFKNTMVPYLRVSCDGAISAA